MEFEGTYSKGNKWDGDAYETDEYGYPIFIGKYKKGIKTEGNIYTYNSENDNLEFDENV